MKEITFQTKHYNNSAYVHDFLRVNWQKKVFTAIFILVLTGINSWSQSITVDGDPGDWGILEASDPAVFNHIEDPFGNGVVDNQFTEGSKDFNVAADLIWADGQTKAKNDIANALAYLDGTTLYFAGDKTSNNGDAQIGFWFYLNNTAPRVLQTSPTQGGDFFPEHAVGDILVLIDFTGGGKFGTVTSYVWVGVGEGDYGNNNSLGLLGTGTVAQNNLSEFPVPDGWLFTSETYDQNQFFEGSIDLATLDISDACFSRFLVEARSSQELTASLDDFAAGEFNVEPQASVNDIAECENNGPFILTATADGGLGTLEYEWRKLPSTDIIGTASTLEVTESGQYSVIILGQGVFGGKCPSQPAIATVDLQPIPILTDQVDEFCEDAEDSGKVDNIDLTSYESAIGIPGGSSGTWYVGDGTGGSLVGNATDVDGVINGSIYTVSYTDDNTCSNTAKVTFTINDLPALTDQVDEFCEDAEGSGKVDNIDLTSYESAIGIPGGSSGTWYVGDGTGGSLVGNATDVDGVINGSIYTVSYTDDNTCSNTAKVTFTINDLPDLTDQTDEFCEDSEGSGKVDNIDLTSYESAIGIPGGSSGTWYVGDGTGGSLVGNATDVDGVINGSIYTVSYTDDNTCSNTAKVTFTINDLPDLTDQVDEFCEDSEGSGKVDNIDLTSYESAIGIPGGSSGTWYVGDGTGGSLVGNATDVDGVINGAIYTVSYTDSNTCSNTAKVTFTINDLPALIDQSPSYCEDAEDSGKVDNIDLTSYESAIGIPGGSFGTWYVGDGTDGSLVGNATDVDGVINGSIYTVSYTDGNTCSNTAKVTISVNEFPILTDQIDEFCEDSEGSGKVDNIDLTSYESAIGIPGGSSGTWYVGDGTGGSLVGNATDVDVVTNGSIYTVSYTDGNTCSNTAKVTFTINDLPALTDQVDEFCEDAEDSGKVDNIDLTSYESAIGIPGGSSGTWYVGDGTDGSLVGNATDVDGVINGSIYTVSYTDSNTCNNTATITFTINPLPILEIDEPQLTCFGEKPSIAVTSSKDGLEFRLVEKGLSDGTFADYTGPFTDLKYDTVYVLTARDKTTGCETDYEFKTPIQVDIPSNLIVMVNDPTCDTYDGSTYFGSIQIDNHVPGYFYAVVDQATFVDIESVPASAYMNYDGTSGLISGIAVGSYYVIAKSPDGCLSAIAPAVLIEPNCITCETAFARDASSANCFDQYPELIPNDNRWGWTNYYESAGNYSLDLYAGAGQCDISKGALVGEVNIFDNGDGTIDVQFVADPGYIMSSVHLYVGCEPLPYKQNGKNYNYTVAPGQYPQNPQSSIGYVTEYTIENISVSGDFYLIAHTDICTSENTDLITSIRSESVPVVYTPKKRFSAMQTCINNRESKTASKSSLETQSIADSTEPLFSIAPVPFRDVLNVGYLFDYTSDVSIQIFDLNGRLLKTYTDTAVNSNSVSTFNVDFRTKSNQIYIVRMTTDREVYTTKIIAAK